MTPSWGSPGPCGQRDLAKDGAWPLLSDSLATIRERMALPAEPGA